MGDAMMISFAELPSNKTGWKDGLHWLREVAEWSSRYEEKCMVPASANNQLAESHLDVLLINAPDWVVAVGKNTVIALLEERLRKAMM